MARKKRIHVPNSSYHCMLRGNNGHDIFQKESDLCRLSLLLQEGIERYDHRILGFCFMSNHIHLVIQVRHTPLSKIIQNFTFRYARYINKKYKKIGHLFQGRFKSILVNDSRYLLELIRYVHLNPIRAKLVKKPEDYFWSGHQTYIGNDPFQWVSPLKVLKRFDETASKAIEKYVSYIYKGIGKKIEIDFKRGNQRGLDVLGDDIFTEKLIWEYAAEKTFSHSVHDIIESFSKHFNCESHQLSSQKHKFSHLRGILAYIIRETKGCSLQELSQNLKRDISTLSNSAHRIEGLMRKDPDFYNEVQTLKESLLSKNLKKD